MTALGTLTSTPYKSFRESRTSPSILMVGNFFTAGATRAISEELALRLRADGWRVLLTSNKRIRVLRICDMLASTLVQRGRYEIAHIDVFSGQGFTWAECVCWMLRCVRRPYLLTLHGGALPEFAGTQTLRVKRLLNSAEAVTAPSAYLQEAMTHYRKDILLIPNALDLSQYDFRPRRRPQPHLIWLRAFHKIYNPEMAVRIVALARQAAPEIRLTMIGPDKGDGQFQRTKQLADRLGLLDRIEFIPGVVKADVPRYLQSGDIFLNTSTVDNTPVSVLEAMACGLCVVSTDVGGLRYLLTHEHDALIAPSADENGMTSAVLRILNDAALSTRLSENARRKVAQLDWSVVLPLWEELFKTTVQRNVR